MPERDQQDKTLKAWQGPFQRLFQLRQGTALALCIVLTVALTITDVLTPPELDLSFAYALVILLATWNISIAAGIVFAAIAAGLQYAELSDFTQSGSLFWSVVVLNRAFTFGMAVVMTGALRRMFDIVRERSLHDALTDAVNASHFIEVLRTEIARSARSGAPFTLAYIDLDDFKSVNTQHGHLKGDAVLRAVVDTAKKSVRNIDTVARLGGDEFAIIFPQTERVAAVRVLERLQSNLRRAMEELGVVTSASIGSLTVQQQGTSVTANDVLSAGDELMFRAKREGKDRIVHESLGAPAQRVASLRSV